MAQLILKQTQLTKPVSWSTIAGPTTAAATSYSIGFELSVQELITLKSIVWQTASEATGLMAIWNASNGSLIASGKGAFSSPVPLLPGQTYVVGVEILQNANVSNVRQVTAAPYPFIWGQRRWNDGGPFLFPSHVGTEGTGFWAGDFTIDAVYQDSETKTEPPEPLIVSSANQFIVTLPHEWMPLGIREWDLQYSRSRDNVLFGNWIDIGTFPTSEIPSATEGEDPDVAGSYTHQALELANTTMFYRYRYRLRTSTEESDWSEIAYAGQVRYEADPAPDSVGPDELQDGAVTTSKLDNLAVTSAKIDNLAVTNAKIGFAAIDTAQIRDLAVQRAKIALAAIDTAQINDAAINTAKIGDAQITNAKIANLAAGNVQADLIQANNIATGAITSTLLSTDTAMANTVLSRLQQATSVVATGLSAVSASMGTLTSGVINGGRIIAGTAGGARVELGPNISTSGGTVTGIVGVDGTGAVTFKIDTSGSAEFKGTVKTGSTGLGNFSDTLNPVVQIVDNTLPGGKIITDSITANQIAANAITSVELAALSVTAGKIAASAVTATEIAAGTITSTQLTSTAIDSMTITLSGGGQMRSSSAATTNGLIFDNAGIRAYGSGVNTLTISAVDGSITANKGTFTGATFQTAAAAPRVVMDTLGLHYYDSTGTATLEITSASGGGIALTPVTLTTQGVIDTAHSLRFRDSGGSTYGRIWHQIMSGGFNYLNIDHETRPSTEWVQVSMSSRPMNGTGVGAQMYVQQSGTSASVSAFTVDSGGTTHSVTLIDNTGHSTLADIQCTSVNCGSGGIATSGRVTTAGVLNTSEWFRSTGQYGWYSEDYGGGIYMTDSTWVRIYNGKGLYSATGQIRSDSGGFSTAGGAYMVTSGGTRTGYMFDSWGASLWTDISYYIPNAWALLAGTQSLGTNGVQGWLWYTAGVGGWSDISGKRKIVDLQEHVKKDQVSRIRTPKDSDKPKMVLSGVKSSAANDTILEKVRRLRGAHFEKMVAPDVDEWEPHIGMIAQEVQKEFPELVEYWEPTEERPSGIHWLDAGHGIDAVLLEAIKELADKVDNLEKRIKEVKA